MNRATARWGPHAGYGRAVKVAADNLKAFRNAIRMCVPSIRLRKPGCAGLSTDGTPKIFSPTVEDDHPLSMTLRRDHSTPPVFFSNYRRVGSGVSLIVSGIQLD
jgi:hypothetical protein